MSAGMIWERRSSCRRPGRISAAEASSLSDVSEIATRLNRFLSHDVRDRRFVSLFFTRLDPARRSLVYAAAGQNGHLFRTNGEVCTLEVTGPLLGVVDDAQPASPEIALEPGELLLLFTDGIAEATSPNGEQFGNQRIFDTVRVPRPTGPRPRSLRKSKKRRWPSVGKSRSKMM